LMTFLLTNRFLPSVEMTQLARKRRGGGIGRCAPNSTSPNHIVALVISTGKFAEQIWREKSI
ncbi:MAG TPA: hypothetical protein VFC92_00320, partial [Bacteroidales bacterium]|nr:hypothetical protein [Bacteroidales bacterium]